MTTTTKTHNRIFKLLAQHPDGMRWVDLRNELEKDKSLHPKTINGLIWKLPARFPDQVYKPSRGIFRLTKFK